MEKELGYSFGEKIRTSDDCVSRQAVKEGMRKYGFHSPDMTITEFIEDELLLVTPTRKVGKWEDLPKALDSRENPCKCSVCNHVLSFMNDYPKSNYCPNCGAEMRVGE